jgi:hypothetical protein
MSLLLEKPLSLRHPGSRRARKVGSSAQYQLPFQPDRCIEPVTAASTSQSAGIELFNSMPVEHSGEVLSQLSWRARPLS